VLPSAAALQRFAIGAPTLANQADGAARTDVVPRAGMPEFRRLIRHVMPASEHMREISKTRFYRPPAGSLFCDFSISDCVFDGCYVRRQSDPGNWTVIRDIALRDITQISCAIDTAIIQDVSLHNLKRQGDSPLFLWGCVFRHVTLSGKISGIKINTSVAIGTAASEVDQRAWDAHVVEFYEAVDWALDISEASFAGGISFEAIPGDKIRRNPETQVLVARKTLLESDWKALDYGTSAFDIALSWFLDGSLFDSVVLAARTGSKHSKADRTVLSTLRDKGIAQ
jgi:hypothetical protein